MLHVRVVIGRCADKIEAEIVVQRHGFRAAAVDIEAVANVHDTHPRETRMPRRAKTTVIVGVIRVRIRVIAEGHRAAPNGDFAVPVVIGVVKRERALGDRRPDARIGVELVHVDQAVAVRVAFEEARPAVFVAAQAPHVPIAITINAKPAVPQFAIHEVADVHLVRLMVSVVVDVIDHAVHGAIPVVIGHVTIGIAVAAEFEAPVRIVVNHPHNGVLCSAPGIVKRLAPDQPMSSAGQKGFSRFQAGRFFPPRLVVQTQPSGGRQRGFLHPPGTLRSLREFERARFLATCRNGGTHYQDGAHRQHTTHFLFLYRLPRRI